MKKVMIACLLTTLLAACQEEEERADAYGTFEAREVIVAAETAGKIMDLSVEEGMSLTAAQPVGLIDTTGLHLQREQLLASIRAVRNKTKDAAPDIAVLEEQLRNLEREKKRTEALLKDKAATPKQLDDIEGQIEVVREQIDRAGALTKTANRGILAEIEPLQAQVRLIEDQIRKCYLHNPIDGTVLVKLAEPAEIAHTGKPLYKIADLREMTLRAYVSGSQLPHVKLGQPVTVLIDENESENQSFEGTISWISDEAEFTPKIVQTKEERVNLVYAIKVRVPNDGSLKIGMPGEVALGRE